MIFKTNVNKQRALCNAYCLRPDDEPGKERYKKSRYLLPLIENKRGLVECWLLTPAGDLLIFDANFLFSSHHARKSWLEVGLGHFLCEPIVIGFYWRDCNY